ncbi:MAG: hypothetical protein ACRD29_16155 [Acidimicrobiales bacterium]
MAGSRSPGPDDDVSPQTRRAWGRAHLIRTLALLVLVIVMGIRTFGSFGGAGVVWSLAGAVVLAVVVLVAVKLVARRRLGSTPPGVRWMGTVSIDVASFRQSPTLADAAPPSGCLSAFFLNHGLASGRLAIEADGLSWTPGIFARLAGAKRWRLGRFDITRVETGTIPGVPRPVAKGIQLWLADGSSVAMQAVTAAQLAAALDAVGMRQRRPPLP